MECQVCNKNIGYFSHTLIICDECIKPSSLKLITKTKAQKTYFLTQKDLKNIRHAKGWNNRYRLPCDLFIIDDIENIAINKYGGMANIKKKIADREKIRYDRMKRKHTLKMMRRRKLHQHLIQLGLYGVKDDFTPCQNYIENGEESGFSIKEIGELMLEMEFYNKYTNYKNILKNVKYESRRERYFMNEAEIEDEAKSLSFDEYIKKNFMNHHKMADDLPPTLREYGFELSEKYYKNYKIREENKKNKKLLSFYSKMFQIKKKKRRITAKKYLSIIKKIIKTLNK